MRTIKEMFLQQAYLIVGKNSYVYTAVKQGRVLTFESSDIETLIKKIPQQYETIKINLIIAKQGSEFKCHEFPKLSSIELRSAVKNKAHESDLSKMLGFGCYITKAESKHKTVGIYHILQNKEIEYCIKHLTDKGFVLGGIFPFSVFFHKQINLTQQQTEYYVVEVNSDMVMHCFVNSGCVVFERYLSKTKDVCGDINHTIQFIQTRYGIDIENIKLCAGADLKQEIMANSDLSGRITSIDIKDSSSASKYFPDLVTSFGRYKLSGVKYHSLTSPKSDEKIDLYLPALKASKLCAAAVCIFLSAQLLKNAYHLFEHNEPPSSEGAYISGLSQGALNKLMVAIDSDISLFNVIKSLQTQGVVPIRLEELYWSASPSGYAKLKLAVKKKSKRKSHSLKRNLSAVFFKTLKEVKSTNSDEYVERFELNLSGDFG